MNLPLLYRTGLWTISLYVCVTFLVPTPLNCYCESPAKGNSLPVDAANTAGRPVSIPPKSPGTVLTLRKINLDCIAIDAGKITVAFVTPQGYIDWLSPDGKAGSWVESIDKETHLANVRGLKINLELPHHTSILRKSDISVELLKGGEEAGVIGKSSSPNGAIGKTTAILKYDHQSGRYFWSMETHLKSDKTIPLAGGEGIQFNNILPADCGHCFLRAKSKRYDHTVMVDSEKTAWLFPHQHRMHYTTSGKISPIKFSIPAMAGFSGEELNPFVTVESAPLTPVFHICPMFYDLHCCGMATSIDAGKEYEWKYRIEYLSKAQVAELTRRSRNIPVSDLDWKRNGGPRLDVGMNTFTKPVLLDKPDEASCFNPDPPRKAWDRKGGPNGSGALVLTNKGGKLVWSATPPSIAPPGTRLQLKAKILVQNVVGGASIRVTVKHWNWRPIPNSKVVKVSESKPLSGTSDGWVDVSIPDVVFGPEERDAEVWFEVVLDGSGKALFSDVDLQLK